MTGEATQAAGLLGGLMMVLKVAERTIDWWLEKQKNKNRELDGHSQDGVMVVRLSDEATRTIRETHEMTSEMTRIVMVRDGDGNPMVYVPRSHIENTSQIAAAIKDVSHSQDRIGNDIDHLSDKVEQVDRKAANILQIVDK